MKSALAYSNGIPTSDSPVTTTGYDALGRPTTVTDPNGHTTTTRYSPSVGSPLNSSVSTNAAGFQTTTAYNPAWGAVTDVTDANGHVTSATYDGLGRRAQVWAPDRPKASNATPNAAFAYTNPTVNPAPASQSAGTQAPLVVSTTSLMPNGNTATAQVFFDGLGRQLETQQPSEGLTSNHVHTTAGSVVSDTLYDAHGWVVTVNNPYWITNAPSTTIFPLGTTVPSQTRSSYDNYGRKTADTHYALGGNNQMQPLWATTYTNRGVDRVDVTPPAGGTPTSAVTDSRGRVVSRTQYLAASAADTATKETTTYAFSPAGDMTGMTDPAGHHWGWTFDLLGRQTSATDPDTGTSHTDYDTAGNTVQTIDGNGTKLKYDYDVLNRKQHQYEWQPANNGWALDNAWTYDTAGKGLPYSSIHLVGSTPSANGTQYTRAVTVYDAADRPKTAQVSIPNWAGSSTPTTYTWRMGYAADGSQDCPRNGVSGLTR